MRSRDPPSTENALRTLIGIDGEDLKKVKLPEIIDSADYLIHKHFEFTRLSPGAFLVSSQTVRMVHFGFSGFKTHAFSSRPIQRIDILGIVLASINIEEFIRMVRFSKLLFLSRLLQATTGLGVMPNLTYKEFSNELTSLQPDAGAYIWHL